MTDVVIAGIGQIPVGEHWDLSLRSMAVKAIMAARKECPDLEPESMFIGNSMGSVISHQANLGSLLADWSNLTGIEGTTLEAAGASGGAALRMAYLAIASGMVNVALAVGVEKITDTVNYTADPAVSMAMENDYETVTGLTPTGQAGLIMRRYIHQHQVPDGAIGWISA